MRGAIMNDRNLLGLWIRRFLLEHMVTERNLSLNTQASYRDTLTLLLPFAGKLGGHAIDKMTVEDLSPAIVRRFLDYVELDRHCSGATRNLRLRSEEHTSELQSLMRISYAVFCLKKKTQHVQLSEHINIQDIMYMMR